MGAPFFITGLPRSRTAWLANLFTTADSFCLHDACKDGWTAKHIARELRRLRANYWTVGDSDSGLLLIVPELVSLFPAARWLFVRNTPERAAASFRKAFPPGQEYPGVPVGSDVEAMMQAASVRYDEALLAVSPFNRMEVTLAELEDEGVVREIWEFLMPGIVCDQRRYQMLNTFRVNIIPEKITVAPVPLEEPI